MYNNQIVNRLIRYHHIKEFVPTLVGLELFRKLGHDEVPTVAQPITGYSNGIQCICKY